MHIELKYTQGLSVCVWPHNLPNECIFEKNEHGRNPKILVHIRSVHFRSTSGPLLAHFPSTLHNGNVCESKVPPNGKGRGQIPESAIILIEIKKKNHTKVCCKKKVPNLNYHIATII